MLVILLCVILLFQHNKWKPLAFLKILLYIRELSINLQNKIINRNKVDTSKVWFDGNERIPTLFSSQQTGVAFSWPFDGR